MGHLECVEELSRCCDIDAQDYDLNTPLHLAAKNDHNACKDLLISFNADVSLTNRNFKTAEELSKEHSKTDIQAKNENTFVIENWNQVRDSKKDDHTIGDHIVNMLVQAGLNIIKGKETEGDGNCFYRAVADQLLQLKIADSSSLTHSALRKRVVRFVRKEFNKSERSSTMKNLISCRESDNSFKQMIEEQMRDGIFANETFIIHMAVHLGIAIKVLKIENEGEHIREELFPSILNNPRDEDKTRYLCIAHYNEHFQSVFDKTV
jgi:sulfur relay (sulfurtransferase) DsrC/TusE family protein